MLQRVIDEQRQQIAALKSQIAALNAQLASLGVQPVNAPATQPGGDVARRAKRVVFIRAVNDEEAASELDRAVNDLGADDWFNVLTIQGREILPFQPHLVTASEFNKKRFEKYLDPRFVVFGSWLPAVKEAAKVDPDVIWLIARGNATDEEALIRDLRKTLAGKKSRINTTVAYTPGYQPKDQHLMWRIAHETGGICVDRDGDAIAEPALPIQTNPEPPTPAPKRGSIFHESADQ